MAMHIGNLPNQICIGLTPLILFSSSISGAMPFFSISLSSMHEA